MTGVSFGISVSDCAIGVAKPVFRYFWLMSQAPDGGPPFGRYLRSAITEAGFRSPTAFARAANVEPSVVLRWISGKAKPTTRTLAAVAPVLKVSPADLVRAAYPDEVTDERPEEPPVAAKPFKRFRRRTPTAGEVLIEGSGSGEPVDVSHELASPDGLAMWMRPDSHPLAYLLHHAGLDETTRMELIKAQRRRNDRWMLESLDALAAGIMAAGGVIRREAWLPWLVEEYGWKVPGEAAPE